MRASTTATFLGLTSLALVACDFSASGIKGNFSFQYTPYTWHSFNTPLAVGAKADVTVSFDDGGGLVSDVSCSTSDSSIVQVNVRGGGLLTLEARKAGVVEITCAGGDLDDAISVESRDVASVDISAPDKQSLGVTDPYVVAQGGRAQYSFILKDSANRTLMGYDFDGFEADNGATVAWTDSLDFVEVTFGDLGVTEVDHPLAVQPAAVQVVDPATVATMAWTALVPVELKVGAASIAVPDARDGNSQSMLGLHGLAVATSTTPTVCTIGEGDWGEFLNAYRIDGLKVGTCTVSVELEGVSATHSLEVVEEAQQ